MTDDSAILKIAATALTDEAKALEIMAQNLDGQFVAATRLLLSIQGRVAVTGMGKSGHVAKKVAATLASTGTPAYYIHPAEASHGDLGMISHKDAVIAYSNSGETEELASILLYAARHAIPVIGITKNPKSFLGVQAEICLPLPDLPEACPIGCAPTTSTTMMMALGDALALCLLQMRGFTPDDFFQYHPGGKLGRKLLRVCDIMHQGTDMPLVAPQTPLPDVLYMITGKRFGCTGVLENGRLVGIITDGDLRRHMGNDLLSKKAEDIMTPDPVTIVPELLAIKALGLMQQKAITNIFVSDQDNCPIGILHLHDCLKAGLE